MRTGKFNGESGKTEFDSILSEVYPNSVSSVNSTLGYHEEVFSIDSQDYVATVPQTLVMGPNGKYDQFSATIEKINPEKAHRLIYG